MNKKKKRTVIILRVVTKINEFSAFKNEYIMCVDLRPISQC